MKKRKYRFFYHYYRQYKCLSIHYRGVCYKVENVVCNVPCESKWSRTQPNLVMRGFAGSVEIKDGVALVN